MSRNNQNQETSRHPFFNIDRAPNRVWMIRHMEKRMDELIGKLLQIKRQAAQMQTLCGQKDWSPEYVRILDCVHLRERLAERMINRLGEELSELRRGETEGWPLRGEVYRSA